jgi:hypothetical protein
MKGATTRSEAAGERMMRDPGVVIHLAYFHPIRELVDLPHPLPDHGGRDENEKRLRQYPCREGDGSDVAEYSLADHGDRE